LGWRAGLRRVATGGGEGAKPMLALSGACTGRSSSSLSIRISLPDESVLRLLKSESLSYEACRHGTDCIAQVLGEDHEMLRF
jgi:hypothetical protein